MADDRVPPRPVRRTDRAIGEVDHRGPDQQTAGDDRRRDPQPGGIEGEVDDVLQVAPDVPSAAGQGDHRGHQDQQADQAPPGPDQSGPRQQGAGQCQPDGAPQTVGTAVGRAPGSRAPTDGLAGRRARGSRASQLPEPAAARPSPAGSRRTHARVRQLGQHQVGHGHLDQRGGTRAPRPCGTLGKITPLTSSSWPDGRPGRDSPSRCGRRGGLPGSRFVTDCPQAQQVSAATVVGSAENVALSARTV
ncbi:unannotated protein [freshwater metagenome]|uniref:Unannotated protein n=1 Tax=freshwater metagenome TaxID=449393 RepID=A0A6J6S2I2_9ZZZZ